MIVKQYIQHRINTIEGLNNVPKHYGVELDVRSDYQSLYLHHDVFQEGDYFEDYLQNYQHKTLIVNTKSEGMEQSILDLLAQYHVEDFFFLDLSIPFLIKTIKQGCSKVCRIVAKASIL